MSSTPFMQLYVSDYLGDTMHLTTEQHGAYLLILMTMWRHEGSLPNDDAKLARIARVNLKRWHLVKGDVLAFFTEQDGNLTHKRLSKELQKAVSISQKRKTSGSLGGLAKSLKNNDEALANAKQTLKHSQKPDTIKVKETLSSVSKNRATRLPDDWVIPQDWIDQAVAEGLPRSRAYSEAERMKNWSISNKNGAKLNWHATWLNWYRDKIAPSGQSCIPPKPRKITDVIRDEARKYGVLPDEPDYPNSRLLDASYPRGSAQVLELPVRSAVAGFR